MVGYCKALGDCFRSAIMKFFFYHNFIASSLSKNYKEKDEFEKNLKGNIEFLTKYAGNAPENFFNKVRLLEAELAAMQKKEVEAKSKFKQAILLSKKYESLSEEAIC